ncbi:hypothetical protein HVC28_002865 [Salmonella enterica]|nr:hypothetical protein [Salmonella enterica]
MKAKKYVGFLLWLLLCVLSLTPFFAQADSVTNPVYQGSVQLRSDAANPVAR